jgi:hypothetical protein
VPGETAAKVVQTKEPQHKDDFDEWLARIICFAFSVPPQWATKAMNRATADNQSAQSEEEGLEPTKEWVKDLIDEIVAEEFASPDLELHWLDEDEGDPETVLEGRVKLGAVTLNEMRDALGLDPFDNAAADRPMVLTATGFVPIEANAGGEGADTEGLNAQRKNARPPHQTKGAKTNNVGPKDAKSEILKASSDDPKHPGWPAGTPGGKGGQFRPKVSDDERAVTPTGSSELPNAKILYQKYGRGHHWVTQRIFKNRDFSDEVTAFFDDNTSGALADPKVNYNNIEHRQYDEAVSKMLDEFLQKHQIAEEKMTVEQASQFLQEVLESSDPIIRDFVKKIRYERFRYIMRYGSWRRGGGGDEE